MNAAADLASFAPHTDELPERRVSSKEIHRVTRAKRSENPPRTAERFYFEVLVTKEFEAVNRDSCVLFDLPAIDFVNSSDRAMHKFLNDFQYDTPIRMVDLTRSFGITESLLPPKRIPTIDRFVKFQTFLAKRGLVLASFFFALGILAYMFSAPSLIVPLVYVALVTILLRGVMVKLVES